MSDVGQGHDMHLGHTIGQGHDHSMHEGHDMENMHASHDMGNMHTGHDMENMHKDHSMHGGHGHGMGDMHGMQMHAMVRILNFLKSKVYAHVYM